MAKRVLLTGAAGALGQVLRTGLARHASFLRLSDIAPMAPPGPNEEIMQADLADGPALVKLTEGIDAIVHFGGRSIEANWDVVLPSNIAGMINLYEAARVNGVERIIFASSNHAIGFHRRETRLDHHSPPRPDTRYGLSKAFGEDIGVFYAYKFGIRSLVLRIGSCFPKPTNARMLSTWLSYPDLVRLVEMGLTADYLFEIVYGVSGNTRSWWDNSNAERLGYRPLDNAERFAGEVGHIVSSDPIEEQFQGGSYTTPESVGDLRRIP